MCEVKRVVLEETVERIDGYRLEIEIDNRHCDTDIKVSYSLRARYEKGQRVEALYAKRTTYSAFCVMSYFCKRT